MAESDSVKAVDKIDGCIISKEIKKEKQNNEPSFLVTDYNFNHQYIEQQSNGENNDNHQLSEQNEESNEEQNEQVEKEPTFTPKVHLPLIDTKTMEDEEDVVVELRARIYRYDTSEDEPEFKERGTGVVKILRHKQTGMYRVLMRRDKTLKICANHYITSSMKLDKHNNSEKVFLYSTLADFYENHSNPETFAIRFSNAENASIFKKGFNEAVKNMSEQENNESVTTEPESKPNSVVESELAFEMEKIKLENQQKHSNDDGKEKKSEQDAK